MFTFGKKFRLKIKFFNLKYFILILISAFSFASFGQAKTKNQSELDVLKKRIRQSTYYDSIAVFQNGAKAIVLARRMNSLSEEGLIYQYYGNFYFFSRNIQKAREYYQKTIEIAKKAGDKKLQNSTEIRLAFMLSDVDKLAAEKKFNYLLEEAIKNNFLENTVEAYNGIGIIYEDRKIHDEALKYYLRALKVAEKNNLQYQQAIVLNNIGLVKFYNKQSKEAKIDFERALVLAIKAEESRLAISLHSNLGLVNDELKNFTESIKHYKETLRNARKLGFPTATAVAMINLANSYFENKQYDQAMKNCDSALSIFKKYNEMEFIGQSFLLRASINTEIGNLKLARVDIDSVLMFYKSYPNPRDYALSFQVLASIFEKEGNYRKALEYTKKFDQLDDSLSDISNQDKMAEMQVVYGKERIESELENEKSKNSLLQKENELKRIRLRFVLILGFSILVLGIGLIFIRSVIITRRQQVVFSQKLIENIDEERSRISKDLHDNIGQSLSVIKSKINMFNTSRIQSIEGLDVDLGDVINQTRSISHHLHPAFLEKIGLSRSLASLMEKVQESTGIVCSLELFKEIESLPIDTKTQIYRIIQECVNNTIKHAQASALKILVYKQDENFMLEYKDNGIGMRDVPNADSGIGILTIKERGNKLNGKVSFISNANGFRLILKF
jgi:signal transduction histidine kinase/Flp pilus assembly protein TadD